jgi:hypothetical protein
MARLVMMRVPTTREREARYGQLWGRLWTRILQNDIRSACELGRQRQSGRNDKCSACTVNTDPRLKILDRGIAQLVADQILVCPVHCPYLIFTRALILALLTGPGAEETRIASERTRIIELKAALKHVDRALKTLAPDREDLRGLEEQDVDELFVRLADVLRAETLIQNAVNFLIENAKRNYGEETDLTKPAHPRRGRPGALEIQGIVSCCADAWKELIGKKPGKNNVNFHGLLCAAAETVLGPLDPEPDWENQIVAARQRQKQVEISAKKSGLIPR